MHLLPEALPLHCDRYLSELVRTKTIILKTSVKQGLEESKSESGGRCSSVLVLFG